jgi:hypothetical protein
MGAQEQQAVPMTAQEVWDYFCDYLDRREIRLSEKRYIQACRAVYDDPEYWADRSCLQLLQYIGA